MESSASGGQVSMLLKRHRDKIEFAHFLVFESPDSDDRYEQNRVHVTDI